MLWTVLIPVGCLLMVGKLDYEEPIVPGKMQWAVIVGLCLSVESFIKILNFSQTAFEAVLLDITVGCLLFASITDWYIGKAYDFIWWIGIAAAFFRCCLKIGETDSYQAVMSVIPLLVFAGLQQMVFSRFYGRADCHAFCVCSFVEGSFGMGMTAFWVHMVLAFALLILMQGICGNIGKFGCLKKPVPFLPYITVSFLLMLCAVRVFRE